MSGGRSGGGVEDWCVRPVHSKGALLKSGLEAKLSDTLLAEKMTRGNRGMPKCFGTLWLIAQEGQFDAWNA